MTDERKKRLEAVLSKRQNNLTVVLEDVWDPHNISAVMRSCDAVGVQEIFVVNTQLKHQQQWGKRSSSSADKWLTIRQFNNISECFSVIRTKYGKVLTTHLSKDSVSLYDLKLTDSVALVFGNENSGVSEDVRALADGNFIIPQMGMIQSLNISVACAVSLYEAYRQKQKAGHYEQPSLSPAEYTVLRHQWGLTNEI
jgi:tRNA (guanosine-2'-O-)-methyltransferase